MIGAVAVIAPRASPDLASGAIVASAGDPSSSRIVYGIVAALIVIGVALVAVAVWVFRQTRVDPEVLAPLETMSDRRWRRLDPASQRRMLDEERPEGAEPLRPATSVPVPDEEFAAGSRPVDGFDDLKSDPEDAAADTEAEVPAERGGVEGDAPLEGGDGPDSDHDVGASADGSPVEADAVGEVGPDVPTADVHGADEVSVGEGGSADVDESVAESPTDGDEVGTDPDGPDADVSLALDAADATASGPVDRAGDVTPPAGETAPPPEELDPTDEPARTDG